MNFWKNKYFLLFLGSWGVLLIASSLMAQGTDPQTVVVASGVLALVPPLLYWVSDKVGSNAPAGRTFTVHRMGDGVPVCRVEGIWIFRGMEEKATWYLRGKKVYAFAQKEYLYRIEGNELYRRGETKPCMKVVNDTVYSLPDSKPIYQTVEQESK